MENEKRLALDLGSNSIGWAVTQSDRIVDTGVYIFPEGVENLGQGEGREMSKNSQRTQYRQARRQAFRRRLRKNLLLRILADRGMCPLAGHTLHRTQDYVSALKEEKMQVWFKLNPYELRKKALEEELSREELGRIFYHIIQRRGFRSNSRNAAQSEDIGTIYKGDQKTDKVGIDATAARLEAHGTLGAYLRDLYPEEGVSYQGGKERIRNRYTTRDMYVEEFRAVWEKQASRLGLDKETATTLGSGRKKEVSLESFFGDAKSGLLFYARPLRSQKTLVGTCTFEPKKKRCLKSHPVSEYVRVYGYVNNLKYDDKPLTEDMREQAVRFLLEASGKKKMENLAKHLRVEISRLDRDKEETCHIGDTIAKLASKKVFGDKWFSFSEEKQLDIWHSLYFFDDEEKLHQRAQKNYGLNDEQAKAFVKITLKDGYVNLSYKVMCKMLPFLKQGFLYYEALALAGVRNAFGEEKWEAFSAENKGFICDNVRDILKKNKEQESYLDPLREFLQSEFRLPLEALGKLYHHSQKEVELKGKWAQGKGADREILGLRNPVVSQVLFGLRKLVNALVEKYGTPERIKVELARELKKNKGQRKKAIDKQKYYEIQRSEAIEAIREHGQPVHEGNILKYRLWKEAEGKSAYSGTPISISDLFDQNKVQVDHIFPLSRSQDDSFLNKVVCFTQENREKGQQTPHEWKQEKEWEEFSTRCLHTFYTSKEFPYRYDKCKRLVSKEMEEGFSHRQLSDTGYISRKAREYLFQVCKNVDAVPGGVTFQLRGVWGLNSILSKLDPEAEDIKRQEGEDEAEYRRRRGEANAEKNRNDHRHHALDAIAIAFSDASHVKKISDAAQAAADAGITDWEEWKKERQDALRDKIPAPMDHFWHRAKEAIDRISVVYKKPKVNKSPRYKRKKHERVKGEAHEQVVYGVRGQLHKETVYGKRTAPGEKDTGYHVRKDLETLKDRKQVRKIVDKHVCEQVEEAIQKAGGYQKGGALPKDPFFAPSHKETKVFVYGEGEIPIPLYEVEVQGSGKVELKRLEAKQVDAIADDREREAVEKAINDSGGYEAKIPKGRLVAGTRKKQSKVYVKDERGELSPVEYVTLNDGRKQKLGELELKETVDAIADEEVRLTVEKAIKDSGGYENKIPEGVFFVEIPRKPKVFMPNHKGGDPVPIRKVRMRETMNNAAGMYEEKQWVNPRNNHHAIVYEDEGGTLGQEVISFWEVVERVNQGDRMFQPPEGTKWMTLQINDMFLLDLPRDLRDGIEEPRNRNVLSAHLYRVQKIFGSRKKFEYTFRKHTAVRSDEGVGRNGVRIHSLKTGWKKYQPIKVKVDILGNISEAPWVSE